ncbi:hypothetical protein EDM53_04640 [Rickettsiales endosymbiont of Peranema trichophorum]|uniref:protein-export chaperone SecB n=1 Tax=Rickettsiales endosymbiont of Peranema trichophorum TaxID=2486577 RepID=UPI001023932B|nr:protein-export chaperone SecB [Rickettsiales endosymbiont of Peranema trichophorum]RZI45787.1 hypothetical protein EDM53_04640 [Rickettsiales endosymbiont of Peranema trichophorum]
MEQERVKQVKVLLEYSRRIALEVFKSSFEVSRIKGAKQQLNYQYIPREKDLGEGVYELCVAAKIVSVLMEGAEQKGNIFTLEVEYCGLFQLEGEWSEEGREELLLVDCATLLFPFLRQKVCDTTVASGYPPVLLEPIDFKALYTQHKSKRTVH